MSVLRFAGVSTPHLVWTLLCPRSQSLQERHRRFILCCHVGTVSTAWSEEKVDLETAQRLRDWEAAAATVKQTCCEPHSGWQDSEGKEGQATAFFGGASFEM